MGRGKVGRVDGNSVCIVIFTRTCYMSSPS